MLRMINLGMLLEKLTCRWSSRKYCFFCVIHALRVLDYGPKALDAVEDLKVVNTWKSRGKDTLSPTKSSEDDTESYGTTCQVRSLFGFFGPEWVT